jgi:hypothetical protein
MTDERPDGTLVASADKLQLACLRMALAREQELRREMECECSKLRSCLDLIHGVATTELPECEQDWSPAHEVLAMIADYAREEVPAN